jgi:DNA-binding NarL/FixJ family response regulator
MGPRHPAEEAAVRLVERGQGSLRSHEGTYYLIGCREQPPTAKAWVGCADTRLVDRVASVTVVIVDDHDIFRRGLARLLREQGLEVVGEAASGEEGVRQVAHSLPDVVVMDINLPGISGIEAMRRLGGVAPHARVLVLTISADEDHVTDAIMAGARGYLLKDASIEQIVAGIRAAAAGESLISPRIAATLLERMRESAPPNGVVAGNAELTEREVEVLRLVSAGLENAAIAQALFISAGTVKNHISNILTKLQLDNRIQAAVHAVQRGIV